ncbi:hypothetical protein [Boudabousia liubingyangii]|nr:hypothetical protein [Boudabousia liubingyangii]
MKNHFISALGLTLSIGLAVTPLTSTSAPHSTHSASPASNVHQDKTPAATSPFWSTADNKASEKSNLLELGSMSFEDYLYSLEKSYLKKLSALEHSKAKNAKSATPAPTSHNQKVAPKPVANKAAAPKSAANAKTTTNQAKASSTPIANKKAEPKKAAQAPNPPATKKATTKQLKVTKVEKTSRKAAKKQSAKPARRHALSAPQKPKTKRTAPKKYQPKKVAHKTAKPAPKKQYTPARRATQKSGNKNIDVYVDKVNNNPYAVQQAVDKYAVSSTKLGSLTLVAGHNYTRAGKFASFKEGDVVNLKGAMGGKYKIYKTVRVPKRRNIKTTSVPQGFAFQTCDSGNTMVLKYAKRIK